MSHTHAPHHQAVFLLVTALVLAGALSVPPLISLFKNTQTSTVQNPPSLTQGGVTGNEKAIARIAENPTFTVGASDAKVTVVEFIDFQCPYCKAIAPTIDALIQEYKDRSVRFVFRNFPIPMTHTGALSGAHAAMCAAEQQRFKDMHDLLFTFQDTINNTTVSKAAQTLGLDLAQFNSCFASKKYQGRIFQDLSDGSAAGVQSTPTFFVNGTPLIGAQPIDVFRRAIDAELAK